MVYVTSTIAFFAAGMAAWGLVTGMDLTTVSVPALAAVALGGAAVADL
jgi:hypothetical protein